MKSVLIVDDEVAIRELVSIMLSGRFKILTAKNGKEAVEKFKLFKPDFVLIDILMPSMNGLEAIKEMKKINPDAKIIALTAYAESRRKELEELGIKDVIEKPFRRKEILQTIEKYI